MEEPNKIHHISERQLQQLIRAEIRKELELLAAEMGPYNPQASIILCHRAANLESTL